MSVPIIFLNSNTASARSPTSRAGLAERGSIRCKILREHSAMLRVHHRRYATETGDEFFASSVSI